VRAYDSLRRGVLASPFPHISCSFMDLLPLAADEIFAVQLELVLANAHRPGKYSRACRMPKPGTSIAS
jgi:hypothetical protein